MKLKALIVDDEYPARQELRFMLEKYSDTIQIVGEAANAHEAWELITALEYSILFLDIHMPGLNGLELAARLQEHTREEGNKTPFVVFVTAYEEFALDAFGVNAVDYLLKPIEPARFDKTLKKIFALAEKREITEKQTPDPVQKAASSPGLIPVEHKGKTLLLEQESIIFTYASDDYAFVKTFDTRYITRFTLKELEARLDPGIFHRCHRSYIVNIKRAREVIPEYNGTLTLVVDDAERSEVPVSRSQAKKIRQILGLA